MSGRPHKNKNTNGLNFEITNKLNEKQITNKYIGASSRGIRVCGNIRDGSSRIFL
jgi:hypothetical protein